jgi:hypothetical protein
MAHARPHPQTRQRSARDLARPLCRRPVGTITERSGNPTHTDRWEWHCGFYPGGPHGEQRYGRGAIFEAARAAFEAAWRDYLPKCSEADFQEWRDQEAWTAEKYRRFDRHERVSPDWRASG